MMYLEKRTDVPTWVRFATPLIAIAITVMLGGIIFALLGYDALTALSVFFLSPLSRADQIADLFVKACPLIIIGTGLVFCYRANIWNIGAEGQLVLGALGAGWVALSFPEASSPAILILMALAAMAAGALWAFIPAILRVRFSTNEILVSLMLIKQVINLTMSMLVQTYHVNANYQPYHVHASSTLPCPCKFNLTMSMQIQPYYVHASST